MRETGTLKPRDLLDTARDLIVVTGGRKPRQSNLHRATSTAYYAMFHTLARSVADLMIGSSGAKRRSNGAWKQAYRALDHGVVKSTCKDNPENTRQIPPADLRFCKHIYYSPGQAAHRRLRP